MKREIHPGRASVDLSKTGRPPTSAVTRCDDTIYVSGFPPFDPATGTVIEAPIERQDSIAAVQATRHKEADDEGNRCDGAGCGNGRDEAGGAARAAAGDKRRRRSDSSDSSDLRWSGPRPGPIAATVTERVDPRPRAWRSGHRPRLGHDGTVGRTAGVRPRRLVSRRHPGGVCSHRGTQPRAVAGRRRLHGGREPANLRPHRVAGTVPARPPSGGAERPRARRGRRSRDDGDAVRT